MKTQNLSKLKLYLSENRILIALSVSLGGIVALIVIRIFEITFINHSTFEKVIMLCNNYAINSVIVTEGAMWIFMTSIVSMLLVPIFHNNKNSTLIILLTFFIVFDSMLAIISFGNQKISNTTTIFISISFMYYIFISFLFMKSVYNWLHDDNQKVDVAKLTFIWTVIIAIFGAVK